MAVLETDLLIDFLRGEEDAVAAVRRLMDGGDLLGVTPVSAAEVLRGAHRRGPRVVDRTVAFLRSLVMLDFDLAAAVAAGRVSAEADGKGEDVGVVDGMVAGIVLRHGEHLVTRDSDYGRVRGLRVERY